MSEFADAWGLVAPEQWPIEEKELRKDLQWVPDQADQARALGSAVQERAAELVKRWSGLPEKFSGTGLEAAYLLMKPVGNAGEKQAEKCFDGAKAMDAFVEALRPLFDDYKNLRDEAAAFRTLALQGYEVTAADIEAGVLRHTTPYGSGAAAPLDSTTAGPQTVVWYRYGPAIDRNAALVDEISVLTGKIREVQEDLNRALQKLGGHDAVGAGRRDYAGASLKGGGTSVKAPAELLDMSPRELREWWAGLSPWEREAMIDAVAAADLDSDALAEKLADAMRDTGTGAADPQNVDVMLDLFGDDNRMVGQAFTTLGGAGLAQLIVGTGGKGPRGLQAAKHVREVFARVTREAGWSSEHTAQFAGELIPDLPDSGVPGTNHLASAIGFLFADPDGAGRIGEAFTVAVADEIDRLERGAASSQGPAGMFAHQGGHDPYTGKDYWLFADGGGDAPDRNVNDPMGRVFQTLGAYPDAALEWLTSIEVDDVEGSENTELGEERVSYWFGDRDWSAGGELAGKTQDGFEGPASLWAGVQKAAGSILNPDYDNPYLDESDRSFARDSLANLSGRIFAELAANESLGAETVSPGGSKALTLAVMQQLPQLAVTTIVDGIEKFEEPFKVMHGFDPDTKLVDADPAHVAKVIGPALTQPDGLAVAQKASRDYTVQVLDRLGQSGLSSYEGTSVLSTALQIDGALDGARMGALRDEGLRSDERTATVVNEAANIATTIIDLPIPGGRAGGYSYGKGTGLVTDVIIDKLANEYEEALRIEQDQAQALAEGVVAKSRLTFQAARDQYGDDHLPDEPDAYIYNESAGYRAVYRAWRDGAEGPLLPTLSDTEEDEK